MAVEVGDTAPAFALKDQNNEVVSLVDFRGRRNVLLMFYPFTFTGICGSELCKVRDELPDFQNDDVQVLAVSVDTPYSHKVWATQEDFDFPLLADFWPHGEVAQAYGVFDEKRGAAVRGTFLIDREGVVRWKVVNPIPTARDTDDYRKALAAL